MARKRRFRGVVAKGYPRKVGRGRYIRHKGGKRYSINQLRAMFATKGWRRAPRKSRRRRR